MDRRVTLPAQKTGLAYPVVEIFGPTIQGEGPVIGRKTMFVRFAGCDSKCVWCDSRFAWDLKHIDKSQIRRMTAIEIFREVVEAGSTLDGRANFEMVTLSGGNPALYDLSELVNLFNMVRVKVVVETQGTRYQSWFNAVDRLVLSPKPPSAVHGGYDANQFDELVNQLWNAGADGAVDCVIKVVVFDDTDYEWAKQLHKRHPDLLFFLQVGNRDVGRYTDGSDEQDLAAHRKDLLDRLDWLVQKVSADPDMNDVTVLPQLHTLLWGNRRGV